MSDVPGFGIAAIQTKSVTHKDEVAVLKAVDPHLGLRVVLALA
jgi:hypothetical protein